MLVKLSTQLAQQLREVKLHGDWVSTNLKTQLADVDWQMATTKIGSLNTIAALTFHLNYYVAGLIPVFEGGTLDIRDKYSFDLPPITSAAAWEELRQKTFREAERLADLIEQLSDEDIKGPFVEAKYGSYFRNIVGMIEHTYYHLGQIVILKKLIAEGFAERV